MLFPHMEIDMLRKIVRSSKFRHAYGVAQKRENCYEDVRVTKNSWDSNFCDVNPKFLAVVTESAGGGAFLVLPLAQTGRLPVDYPLVTGHRASILDLAWCPHDDHILASASEDCSVKIWEIPADGLIRKILEPIIDIGRAHERRVSFARWHPAAGDILLTAGGDFTISGHPDQIMSASWNYDGSLVLTTCRDKMIRVFDSRSGNILKSVDGHTGLKPSRGLFLKDGRIFTTGFSKMSIRQYALWDLDQSDEPLVCEDIDSSNGTVFPFYDPDINMIYLAGKGDSSIRYFEYTKQDPYIHYIDTFTSTEPYRGVAFMPKRGLDINHCEIARFYQLKNSNYCQIVGIFVPRKSEDFQEDLYPQTLACVAATSAEEWWSGVNINPAMMDIKPNFANQNAESTTNSHHTIQSRTKRRNPKNAAASDRSSEAKHSNQNQQNISHEFESLKSIINDVNSQFIDLANTVKQLCKRVDVIEKALRIKT
ncbi:hypothetical protein GJ496_008487 [Pomphorhynchus laevis]|nr:hypothetical protein GJ496_008487 [Pomphorhynchus laevis]